MRPKQTPSIQMRIRFSTYQALKRTFPHHTGESFANYFERLSDFIKENKNES